MILIFFSKLTTLLFHLDFYYNAFLKMLLLKFYDTCNKSIFSSMHIVFKILPCQEIQIFHSKFNIQINKV